jgi:hypothetical protein
MPITINGSGTIGGLNAGGLPDDCITTADIAANAVTYAKIGTTEQGQLCKAWVNFNGTTASPSTIRGSYNVSSVTKNGTGDYTVNFTAAMVDANYAAMAMGLSGTAAYGDSWSTNAYNTAPVAGSIRISNTFQDDNSNTTSFKDSSHMYLVVFR